MRVAVVHDLRAGGAHRRVAAQLAELRELGCEPLELTLGTAEPVTADAMVVPVARWADRARAGLRPPLRYADLAALLAAYRRLWRLTAGWAPDVVWVNPCQFLQTPALAATAPAPVVYYCDEPRRIDAEPDARATQAGRTRLAYGPLRAAERRLDRAGVAAAAVIATNSRYTAGRIDTAYGREATVVPCGVASFFAPPAGRPAEPTQLLSVGTLIPSKGHDLAIAATARAGIGLPLVVVAPRPVPAEQDRLRRCAAELGVRLEMRTGIADAELRELYRTAFATLYLARREPFGLASLEAQACGSPVVVAAEGGLPETVADGVSGWAVDRDPAAAADRLTRLIDPGVRGPAVVAAAAHARRASWARSARHLADLFEQVGAAAPSRVRFPAGAD